MCEPRKGACQVHMVNLTPLGSVLVHSILVHVSRKMVNVNTPLPFNLRNKDLEGRRQDPSSSRSARSHSAHPAIGAHGPEMLPDVPSRMPSYSPTRDRDPSPSLQASQSTTSLHPGDASYLPPDTEAESGNRHPIFNARLVKGAGGFGIGGDFASRPRQGRSVTRGRSSRADSAPVSEESRDGDGTLIAGESHAENGHASAEQSAEAATDATPRAAAFKIEDVGKIACSWGD